MRIQVVKRRIELTPAGKVFSERTRALLEGLDLAVREAKRASVGETGRIVVGYLALLAYSGIIDLIRTFHERFPGVELTLREMAPQAQLDVGLVRGKVNDPSLSSAFVQRDPLLVVLPAGHELAKRKRIPLGLLATTQFVLFPRARNPVFFDQIMSLCRAPAL